jgi:hypothetical protein
MERSADQIQQEGIQPDMSLSAAERETIVRFSDDLDEPMTVYTSREAQARRLLFAGATLVRRDTFGWHLECPRSWFRGQSRLVWRVRPKSRPRDVHEKPQQHGPALRAGRRNPRRAIDGSPGAEREEARHQSGR